MDQQITIEGRTLKLTRLEKVLYPAGFTKAEVIDYYVRVAPFLLPHLHNRPVTLKRYPDGVEAPAFWEKDAPGFTPEWVERFPVPRHGGGLVAQVGIREWTEDGHMRHSTFLGLREDKNPREVVREQPATDVD